MVRSERYVLPIGNFAHAIKSQEENQKILDAMAKKNKNILQLIAMFDLGIESK
jgi:hypothetical protein